MRSLISTWMERNGRRFAPRPGELREAASKGGVEEVRALLRAGTDCDDKRENGGTAPFEASEKGHRDVAELLVEAGADVNRANVNGKMALMSASREGHRDVVKALLEAGADVNQANAWGYGGMALMKASHNGHRDVVEALVGAGADVNQADEDGWTALIGASEKGPRDVKMVVRRGEGAVGVLVEGELVWEVFDEREVFERLCAETSPRTENAP